MRAAFEESSPVRKTVDIVSNRMLLDDRLISATVSERSPVGDPDQ